MSDESDNLADAPEPEPTDATPPVLDLQTDLQPDPELITTVIKSSEPPPEGVVYLAEPEEDGA